MIKINKINRSFVIKVAQIRWGEPIGGVERVLKDLACYIDRNAFKVLFVFLRSGGGYEAEMHASGHGVMVIPARNGYDIGMRIALIKELRKFAPDIINEHGGIPPLIRPMIKMAIHAPLVSFEHGEIEVNQRRGKAWVNKVNGFELRHFSDKVIVNSLLNKNLLATHHRLPEDKIQVVHLGIDLNQFVYNQKSPITSELIIGYVGRINNSDKGTDFLPLLVSKILSRGFRNFRLQIIGDGPDRKSLESLVGQRGISGHVDFLGMQPNVHDLLSNIDILVVPSRTEAFGLVAIEALAAGTRVVAFATGALPEILSGCPDAQIVPQGDIPALADAVLNLWKSKGKQRSQEGRNFVIERYDARRMVGEMENVYKNMLQVKI